MSRFPPLVALCAVLLLAGCLGGPPPDVPYGSGGAVEGEVIPNDHARSPIPFDSPTVQSDEHLQEAVTEAVESPDRESYVTFASGEGKSVYEASQRLHDADVSFVEHGYAVAYGNQTVVVRVQFLS